MKNEPWAALAERIKHWGRQLGFDAIGISDIDLSAAEPGLRAWLDAGYHGDMDYMEKHGMKRARPAELVPGTIRVISVRLPYLPASLLHADDAPRGDAMPRSSADSDGDAPARDWRAREAVRLRDPRAAVVSVYARGRDYHKVMRQRLQRLADRIATAIGPFGYRVFTDSAPVMEVELARRAGVGWRGKHTLLLSRDAGSFFFIGELYVDVPLPIDATLVAKPYAMPDAMLSAIPDAMRDAMHQAMPDAKRDSKPDAALCHAPRQRVVRREVPGPTVPAADGEHCGQCRRCIDACPTGAIVAPYRLDARRCISYLTIEYKGSIPEPMRAALGNRIYGCDDCQTVCPWNKFAKVAPVPDFDTRNGLDSASLIALFAWSESDFDTRLAGTAIRRIGHQQWLRNIAVALGNALRARLPDADKQPLRAALLARRDDASALVREHVEWALLAATSFDRMAPTDNASGGAGE